MSDLGQLNAALAEALDGVRAAETALEAAYAAAARDFGIVEAVAGSDPGRTLGRSLTQLQEAMTSIRAERARLAGARADIQTDLARLGQGNKLGTITGASPTATRTTTSSTGAERWADPTVRKTWYDEFTGSPDNRFEQPSQDEWADFQRRHAGRYEYELKTGYKDETVRADGLALDPDTVVAIEVKFVDKPRRSMYEGKAPAFMEATLFEGFDDEMRRYGAVIRHDGNPVGRLRIVASTQAAGEFLGARARRLIGEGVEIDVQVRPEGDTQ